MVVVVPELTRELEEFATGVLGFEPFGGAPAEMGRHGGPKPQFYRCNLGGARPDATHSVGEGAAGTAQVAHSGGDHQAARRLQRVDEQGAALTWDRVDLSRGVIRLEQTKSGRRREVPLNDASYRAVVSLKPKDDGRVFQTRYIKTAYNNAATAAKLDNLTFHALRHTFASWAVMRGVSLKELQELLRHATLAMTMRYAHLAPEHLCTAVSRLEGLTSARPAADSTQEPTELVGASQKSL